MNGHFYCSNYLVVFPLFCKKCFVNSRFLQFNKVHFRCLASSYNCIIFGPSKETPELIIALKRKFESRLIRKKILKTFFFCDELAILTAHCKEIALSMFYPPEVRVVQVGRVASQVVCQGTTLKFKCQNTSLAMVIYSAVYGREYKGDVCPFAEAYVDDSVIRANETDDQTLCKVVDVTRLIRELCDKKRRCNFSVNETYFGNPCKKIYKYVNIIYGCGKFLLR